MKNCFLFRHQYFPGTFLIIVSALLSVLTTFAAPTDEVYLLGPDSAPHAGVPQGKVIGPLTLASDVFTNTTRATGFTFLRNTTAPSPPVS